MTENKVERIDGLTQGVDEKSCQKHKGILKVTLIGAFFNILLVGLKIVVGFFIHSQSLIADGIHSLSDLVTDVAVIVGERYWRAPADKDHPYGHGRIETLVTVFIGIVLGIVGFYLGIQSINSLMQEKKEIIYSTPMIIVALFSVISKEWLYRYSVRIGNKVHSTAVIANAWHHRSDSLSSIPVIIAGIGISINPAYSLLDPIGALVVSSFIIYTAYQLTFPMLNSLIDHGVSPEEIEKLDKIALSIEGVKSVHAVRSRSIGGGIAIDLHVRVEPSMSVYDGHIIAGKVKRALLKDGDNVVDVLVHIEPEGPPSEKRKEEILNQKT